MSQLNSAMREKLDGMLTELRDLLELKQQRMLKELQSRARLYEDMGRVL